nr:9966_t:CDS:2 [Entrophospora candida]CAG8552524.1 5855_t:CDS:2 [Entrophospora candida]
MLDLSVKLNLKIRDINELITCILEYMNETASTKKLSYPLKTGKEQYRILTTGDQIIDKIIGGGIYNKGITEIVGESSVGKTQLCLQLCLTVQLPIEFGGFAGGAVYVSTESRGFPLERFNQIMAQIKNKYNITKSLDMAKEVYYISILDIYKQDHILNYQLSEILDKRNIKLIIIDSITANFRLLNVKNRSKEIYKLGIKLKEISKGNKIPALGLAWNNTINARIMLARPQRNLTDYGVVNDNRLRTISLLISPYAPRNYGDFYIDNTGIHGFLCKEKN